MSTMLDLPEDLRSSTVGFSSLIKSWNSEFFEAVCSDLIESQKLNRLNEILARKRPFLDVSFQNSDYVRFSFLQMLVDFIQNDLIVVQQKCFNRGVIERPQNHCRASSTRRSQFDDCRLLRLHSIDVGLRQWSH